MNDHPPDLADNQDLTGQEIGDYYLIRRLGRGGMADVYLAEQRSLKRNVALNERALELAKKRVDAGVAAILDQHQAESNPGQRRGG